MAPTGEENHKFRWPPLFPEPDWQRIVKHFRLSKRQAEVAALLCRELLVTDVAVQLGISRHAVRHHSKALFRKLGVKSRVGVVLSMMHAHRRRNPPYMRM